jgi:hypothetical protein
VFHIVGSDVCSAMIRRTYCCMSVAKRSVLLTTTRTSPIQRERIVSFPWQQFSRKLNGSNAAARNVNWLSRRWWQVKNLTSHHKWKVSPWYIPFLAYVFCNIFGRHELQMSWRGQTLWLYSGKYNVWCKCIINQATEIDVKASEDGGTQAC